MKSADKIFAIEVTSAGNALCPTLQKIAAAALMLTALLSGPVALSDEIAVAASNPSRIYKSHEPNCRCPSCGSFFDSCPPSCPPAVASQYLPMEPSTQRPAPLDEQEGEDSLEFNEVLLATQLQPRPSTGPTYVPAPQSSNPGMIGDFLFGGYRYGGGTLIDGASVAIAGGGRVSKIAENSSPLPQNRVFFNYNSFSNATQDVNGDAQNVDQILFGVERTFLDGLCSLEFRLPFSGGVDATQSLGESNTLATEFGNLTLAIKALLFQRNDWSVSTGLGMIFPTAEDAVIASGFNGSQQIDSIFTNESFYLQPFLGVHYSSQRPLFFQFFMQTSFDTSGSEISVVNNNNVFSAVAAPASDRVYTQSLLFLDFSLDFSAGYWIYRPKCQRNLITGIASMIELHYTSTISELDLPDFQSPVSDNVFESNMRNDQLNITAGVLINIGRSTSLRVAGVAPLRSGRDRSFDSSVSVQLIRGY